MGFDFDDYGFNLKNNNLGLMTAPSRNMAACCNEKTINSFILIRGESKKMSDGGKFHIYVLSKHSRI